MMRFPIKTTLACCLALCFHAATAQEKSDDTKKIVVVGSAEMEVVPDEIFFSISLREYKDGSRKITINQLEEQLAKAAKAAGIPKEDLRVDNIYGYNWNWRENKSGDFLASKSFRLKVKDLNKVNGILAKLDEKGINNAGVHEFSHSKIEEYRIAVKKKALLAAKEKAKTLLESIGEKAGRVLEVHESTSDNPAAYPMMRSNMAMESTMADYQPNMDFKNIKIRAEIKAAFEIL